MIRLLMMFWPVLIPLCVYTVWYVWVRAKAQRAGDPLPRFRDGPFYWMVLAMLAVGVFCFIVEGLNNPPTKGVYTPSRLENGTLKPGTVAP